MNTTRQLIEQLEKLSGKKVMLKEGFKANSGLSSVLVRYKKHPENFSIDPNIHKEIVESGIKGDDIFSFASLFKKDSFRIEDIRNGKLEAQIKQLYISDEDVNRNLKKAQALKKFVSAMDEYYQEKNWPSKW